MSYSQPSGSPDIYVTDVYYKTSYRFVNEKGLPASWQTARQKFVNVQIYA